MKLTLKKIWHFLWHEDSIWSWLVNIVLAFILIKFIVYPGLGLLLGTSFPIVAVVSSSMHHDAFYDTWWESAGQYYQPFNIEKADFKDFPLRNGFNKGDIMILIGKKPEKVFVGDVIVFQSSRPDPIIHRIVKKWQEEGITYYQTKGDNYKTNPTSLQAGGIDETRIPHELLKGKAILRIPFLGYIKIWFVDLINMVR